MTGLNNTLNISGQSLYASRQGMNTTSHNIANAHTEGYSRQRVDISAHEPLASFGHIIGAGAKIANVSRARDVFLERKLNAANSAQGDSEARFKALREVEAVFSPELEGSINQQIDLFFEGLQALASHPEELSVRSSLRDRGANLASAFNSLDAKLKGHRRGLNEELRASVDELNRMVTGIAALNTKIRTLESGEHSRANDLRDQRDMLLRELSKLIDLSYYEDQHGMVTVRGAGSALLVDRGYHSQFSLEARGEDGMYDIKIQDPDGHVSQNITNRISGGVLKAIIDIRDRSLKELQGRNDQLAYTLANSVNEIHRQGFGLGEYSISGGRNFFHPPSSLQDAALNFGLDRAVLGSTNAIAAASTAGTAGDNVNVNRLIKLKASRLLEEETATFNEYFANNVSLLGVEAKRAEREAESNNVLVADLTARVEAVSGVSLDEEAMNMIKWQTAFTATSKLISAIDEMYQDILGIR